MTNPEQGDPGPRQLLLLDGIYVPQRTLRIPGGAAGLGQARDPGISSQGCVLHMGDNMWEIHRAPLKTKCFTPESWKHLPSSDLSPPCSCILFWPIANSGSQEEKHRDLSRGQAVFHQLQLLAIHSAEPLEPEAASASLVNSPQSIFLPQICLMAFKIPLKSAWAAANTLWQRIPPRITPNTHPQGTVKDFPPPCIPQLHRASQLPPHVE